jgi:6,7-dimethyl-8-ribityllumazine synthase
VIVVGVAFIMGFRTGAGVLAWLAVAGILLLFTLALTWLAVIAGLSAKTVDGGIYRHEFVAAAVVQGLMRASMDSGVPVLSVSLTPHQYQETEPHRSIFRAHFVEKGREAARAALMLGQTRSRLAA